MEVRITTDYDQFSFLEENREVKKVDKLEESLKAVGQICPVVCDSDMKIYDGQNRFIALKNINQPVMYVVNPSLTPRCIIEANVTQKKWGISDYARFYAKKGYEDYVRLLKIAEDEGISVDVAFCLNFTFVPNSTHRNKFKDGDFVFNSAVFLRNLHCLNHFSFFKKYKTSSFIQAAIRLFNNPLFDEERLLQKLEICAGDLIPSANRRVYCGQLERLYNYGQQKSRIDLTSDQ